MEIMGVCEDLADNCWFARLRLMTYGLSYVFAAALTFLDLTGSAIVNALSAVTLVLFCVITVLEFILVCASCGKRLGDRLYIGCTVKLWYLLKGVALFVLVFVDWISSARRVVLPELVLVVLSFEGAWHVLWHYKTPRSILERLQLSLSNAGAVGLIILVVTLIFALLGWVLFKDITPAMLQSDGVVGPDTLFPDILFSFITLWQIAQADNVGAVTRAMERLRPGAVLYFVTYNLLVYYLLTNLLIAMFTATYLNLHTARAATVLSTEKMPAGHNEKKTGAAEVRIDVV